MSDVVIRRTGSREYGRWIKALICSNAGSGKTLVASTAPDVYYANAEGESNLMSIAHKKLPYTQINAIEDLFHVKNILQGTPEDREKRFGFPVNTLVVDTIDEIQNLWIREYLAEKEKDSLTLPDYGKLRDGTADIVRALRNLDMHVIFLCHLKDDKDEISGKITHKPSLVGQYANNIASAMNLAFTIVSEPVNVVRDGNLEKRQKKFFQTNQDDRFDWIRDNSYRLPAKIELNFDDDFQRIIEIVYDGLDDDETTDLPDSSVQTEGRPTAATVAPVAGTEQAVEIDGILVRNELPEGIKPSPQGFDTNIFCVRCGKEIKSEEHADISRIKFHELYCDEHFKAAQRSGKSQ